MSHDEFRYARAGTVGGGDGSQIPTRKGDRFVNFH
jgi:hypothetical protein